MKQSAVKHTTQRRKRVDVAISLDAQDLLSGPSETMSASIPQPLLAFVRARSAERGFSELVTRALFREAVRLAREEIVKDVEDASGPLDPKGIEAILKVLQS